MDQIPSIGRIVHYHTRGSADGVFPPAVFAAIITQVHDAKPDVGHPLDLATFGPNGIRFEHGVEYGEDGGQWNWPPRV